MTAMAPVPPSRPTGGGIIIRDVSMTFPGTRALKGVDLALERGVVHALLGANGCGKSTLVKILSGFQSPDSGSEILVDGVALQLGSPAASLEAGLRFVHQDLALVDTMTVTDNIQLTGGWPTRLRVIDGKRAENEAAAILGQLGADIDPTALVGELSPAMKTIVAVARALRPSPSDTGQPLALILDEPTATLRRREVATVERVIRDVADRGTAVMVISHHLQEALNMADVVTVLRDGEKVVSAEAGTLSRASVITAMMGEGYQSNDLEPAGRPGSRRVLECRHLVGESVADVSLVVGEGEIVGIAGLEGSGRDQVLPLLFGANHRYGGTIELDGQPLVPDRVGESLRSGLVYLPANRPRYAAIPEMTVRENVTIAKPVSRFRHLSLGTERRQAVEWAERVSVRPRNATEKRLATFSGGNQQKVMLARCLRLEPTVLLLDEPTQGIDVGAQAALHRLLTQAAQASGLAMVVSSSDEEELATL